MTIEDKNSLPGFDVPEEDEKLFLNSRCYGGHWVKEEEGRVTI